NSFNSPRCPILDESFSFRQIATCDVAANLEDNLSCVNDVTRPRERSDQSAFSSEANQGGGVPLFVDNLDGRRLRVWSMTATTSAAEALDAGARRERTDRELLDCFVAHGDHGAFAELVARHGACVWAVCRRVLGQEQDAEDAFQAVFLILGRKAGAIRKRESVGSWLHGVAFRTAMKVRRATTRRQARVRHAGGAVPDPSPSDQAAARELQRL